MEHLIDERMYVVLQQIEAFVNRSPAKFTDVSINLNKETGTIENIEFWFDYDKGHEIMTWVLANNEHAFEIYGDIGGEMYWFDGGCPQDVFDQFAEKYLEVL